MNWFGAFKRDENGAAVILFALALVPLAGAAGVSVDYGRVTTTQASMQKAVDAAAISALLVDNSDAAKRPGIATGSFQANLPAGLAVTPALDLTNKQATVSASVALPTSILGVLGISSVPVSVTATAVKVFNGAPTCIFALSKNASPAIQISGSSSFTGKKCALHANSAASGAIDIGGSATVSAAGYCAVGSVLSSVPLSPSPKSNCDELDDPYAKLAAPSNTACDHSKKSVNSGGVTTLYPGVYCGGLDIKTDAVLQPGLYVIKDGELSINAKGSVKAEGVTFYLMGTKAGFTINGGAELVLKASDKDPYAGMLIVQDRNSNPGQMNTINGNSTSTLVGSIYLPTQDLTLNGNGTFGQNSPYMPIIANTVKITGNNTTTVEADETKLKVTMPISKLASGARLAH